MKITSVVPLALAAAFTLGSFAATAQESDPAIGKPGKPLGTQQQRMRTCNAEAKAQSLKGDERKAFMSTCLKGGAKAVAANDTVKASEPTAAQLKRKACSDDAKSRGIKGGERKEFMRTCVRDDRLSHAD